jgi:protein-tyrosine phosphatase
MTDEILGRLARSINLRDLGGIPAAEDRRVRAGALFRSAALDELTPAERAALAGLGVRTVIDLRYNSERARHPTPWEDLGCSAYWAHDYEPSGGGDLGDLLKGGLTREGARDLMLDVYRKLPFLHVEGLQQLFRAVASGQGPILFHCTSGKDRTGMSAALILSALGTPREAIFADYLGSLNFDVLASRAFRHVPPERRALMEPIYFVERAYLEAMFEAIEAHEGSVEGFLRGTLALEAAELAAVRETLLG